MIIIKSPRFSSAVFKTTTQPSCSKGEMPASVYINCVLRKPFPSASIQGRKKKKKEKKEEKKRKNSQHYLPLSAKEHNIDLPFPTAIVCPFAK